MNDPTQLGETAANLASPEEREAAVYRRFTALGIAWRTHEHAPVFTVEGARDLSGSLPGMHTKNLFLEDRKGRHWLVVAREDLAVDLNTLAKQIAAPRFSFGKTERLIELLGVPPGSVNPFALMNDGEGQVTVVLDRDIAEAELVNFHPMRNDRTTAIAAVDLIRFLKDCGHEPVAVVLPERA